MKGLTSAEADVLAMIRARDSGLGSPEDITPAQAKAAYALIASGRCRLVRRECGHPDCRRLDATPAGREALRIHEAIAIAERLSA